MRLGMGALLFLAALETPAMAGLCEDTMGALGSQVPHLHTVTGTPEDLTYTLRSWARDRNSNDGGTEGASVLATHIAQSLVAHARTRRGFEFTDARARGFVTIIGQVLFELVNNASYHGNGGDRAREVTVRVRCNGDQVTVEITDQSGRYFDIAPLLVELSPEEVANRYIQAADGGRLGLPLVLQGAMERYRFTVISQAAQTGTGTTTGTRVIVGIDLPRALAPSP